MLLDECSGDDLWSVQLCQEKGIPQIWIDELTDAYESGFQSDSQTIYYRDKIVNQFEGVRDVDLAIKLAEYLGVDSQTILPTAPTRSATVTALKEAVEEL